MLRALAIFLSLPVLALELTGCSGPENLPPVAVIGASATVGRAPFTVALTAEASFDPDGTITRFDWTLGDGGAARGINVTHTYPDLGAYRVKLTVTDDRGATGASAVSIRVVKELPCPRGSADNGELQLTLRSTRTAQRIGENFEPAPGNRFVILDLAMRALADEQLALISSFQVEEEDGRLHGFSSATYLLDRPFPSATLDRGESADGQVAFEVRVGARELKLRYDPILSSEMALCFSVPP